MTRPYAPGHRIPTDLLLKAYASGVFPMAESASDPEVFWVRPESRGIIPLDAFHVPRSLAKLIRQDRFEVTFDGDFEGVIDGCAETREERRYFELVTAVREALRRGDADGTDTGVVDGSGVGGGPSQASLDRARAEGGIG